jgi:hypothetical protein
MPYVVRLWMKWTWIVLILWMAKLFQGKNQHPAHNNERVLIKRRIKVVHNERDFLGIQTG